MAGSIKLFRQFREWEWYTDVYTKSVFIELLLIASYKDTKWRGIDILRGQAITSRAALAETLEITEQRVRTALAKLQKTGEIVIKSTNKFSIVTICNFDKWQLLNGEEQPTINQQLTSNQPTTNQQLTTYNKVEESKEVNNIDITHTTRTSEEEKFFAQMKRQMTAWQADACRVLGVQQPELQSLVELFEVECRAKGTTHISWKDASSHFIDWGRRQVEKTKKTQVYEKNRDRARTFETNATSASDFYKSV